MNCKLIAISKPVIEECDTAEELIAYCARVSNPKNQGNKLTAAKLLKSLVRDKHWSPFEQVVLTIQIETTRDIGRQILRHGFKFQEFSQRYAEVAELSPPREARLQDTKNRQNSIPCSDEELTNWWQTRQQFLCDFVSSLYKEALDRGIAKEQARAILPEGLTMSRMYVTGNLRNWIHYCQLRSANGTQKEHIEIATKCWEIILDQFPSLCTILEDEDTSKPGTTISYSFTPSGITNPVTTSISDPSIKTLEGLADKLQHIYKTTAAYPEFKMRLNFVSEIRN